MSSLDHNIRLVTTLIRGFLEQQTFRPLIIGLSGPQGSGKSSIAKGTCKLLLQGRGLRTLHLSLDDFYLSASELAQLYDRTACPLYRFRGNPGTHDVVLLLRTLKALRERHAGSIDMPVYDKLHDGGRGERIGWQTIQLPLDVVILEGWMIGYRPHCGLENCTLNEINEALKLYEESWALLDELLWIQIPSLDLIYQWRWQQEVEAYRSRDRESQDQQDRIKAFVDLFMPSYRVYYQDDGIPTENVILLVMDQERRITEIL